MNQISLHKLHRELPHFERAARKRRNETEHLPGIPGYPQPKPPTPPPAPIGARKTIDTRPIHDRQNRRAFGDLSDLFRT